ncbi:hypothetical protein F4859DRAFT_460266 [Xylaria cf. heliscus]|nr:hypothetical protein F4859DRAFT_460266 [Xylaria cf. heliscus]
MLYISHSNSHSVREHEHSKCNYKHYSNVSSNASSREIGKVVDKTPKQAGYDGMYVVVQPGGDQDKIRIN